MSAWKCYLCKVDMEEVDDISISFKETDLPDACGFRCPQCGMEFLEGEFVADELVSAEQMLQGK